MSNKMGHTPFQTLFHRGALFANDLGKAAHRWGIKIDIESTRDYLKAGKLCAAQTGDKRCLCDIDRLEGKWPKLRPENPQRIFSHCQNTFSNSLMLGNENGSESDLFDLLLLRTQVAPSYNRKISQRPSREGG